MNESHLPNPPHGYFYHGPLFQKRFKRGWLVFLAANLIALIPFGLGLLLLWVPYQLYLGFGTPFAVLPTLQMGLVVKIMLGLLIFVLSMLLHEWLHGLALIATGHPPKYYFRMGVLFAGLNENDFLPRRHYLLMSLTPLVVMSVVGFVVLLFLPPVIGRLLLTSLLLNAAASLGDLMVTIGILRAPKQAVFTDEKGIQIFLPSPIEGNTGA